MTTAIIANGFWEDTTTQENRLRQMYSTEYAFFVKDDYRVRRDLTLNLGLRYEYYSPAYLKSGLTSTLIDQGNGLFGANRNPAAGRPVVRQLVVSRKSLPRRLWQQRKFALRAGRSKPQWTARLDLRSPIHDERGVRGAEFTQPRQNRHSAASVNNFGPAVGFSWNLPWLGAGKTTIRGGYSIQFSRVNVSEGTLASALGSVSEPSNCLWGQCRSDKCHCRHRCHSRCLRYGPADPGASECPGECSGSGHSDLHAQRFGPGL